MYMALGHLVWGVYGVGGVCVLCDTFGGGHICEWRGHTLLPHQPPHHRGPGQWGL